MTKYNNTNKKEINGEFYPKRFTATRKANEERLYYKWIYSTVLGDGSLMRPLKEHHNSRFYLSQLEVHKDYVFWLADRLSSLTRVEIYYREPKTDAQGNHKPALVLASMTHPIYTTLRRRVYINGIKSVSVHDLKQLDWEMAAQLYMEDGHIQNEQNGKGTYTRLFLNTHSYTYGDNKLLRDAIAEKLNVHFDVKQVNVKSGIQYRLVCSKIQAVNFVNGVTPHIVPSFFYKVSFDSRTKSPDACLSGDDIV